jgi:hypothetical protein
VREIPPWPRPPCVCYIIWHDCCCRLSASGPAQRAPTSHGPRHELTLLRVFVCSDRCSLYRCSLHRSLHRRSLHQNLPSVACCRRRLLPERRALPRRAAPFMAARMAARRLPHARWQAGGGWPRLLMAAQAQDNIANPRPLAAYHMMQGCSLNSQASIKLLSRLQAIKAPSHQGFPDRAPLIELPSQ